MKKASSQTFFILLIGIALVGSFSVVMKPSMVPQAEAAQVFCRSATPNIEGEPAEDSTQTRCIDKKSGTEYFICEGTYAEVGSECGQTFEVDKKDLQESIKAEREFCKESEDATCEKIKADNP